MRILRSQWAAIASSTLLVDAQPASYHDNAGVLQYVNPKIGTSGITPNQNGGMIPSVSVPFGMTRWTPQTRENFISQAPYNDLDNHIHGFQATHQPAIWMGESGQVVIAPGVGSVAPLFENRAHAFHKSDERSTPYVYEVTLGASTFAADQNATESIYSPVPGGQQDVPGGVEDGANGRTRRAVELTSSTSHAVSAVENNRNSTIHAAMTATSHVGHLRFDFDGSDAAPYIFIQATRKNWTGHINVDCQAREISGSNPQRQDYALGPSRAPKFSGYFVSRFSQRFASHGIALGGDMKHGHVNGTGELLGAYVTFPSNTTRIEVRTGVSFVSIEQARRNLDIEAPTPATFDQTVEQVKKAWLEKLGRVKIDGVNKTDTQHDPRTIWYTGLFHALQYPNDYSEPLDAQSNRTTFYSGYTDSIHETHGSYYQSWSIWDTFRAEHSVLTLFAPERVNPLMNTLLKIFDWSGRLPMWANVVETNIMVGTHVDVVIANALSRGFKGFDIQKAWAGVKKNAFEPPMNDTQYLYYDREGYTPNEVRAGLTTYMAKGYVANDWWSESSSRTLDYAFDDYAASIVASHAGDNTTAAKLKQRSSNYKILYNNATGFMEAKNDNGTWAGPDQGWTEGDKWIYTFDVMHDPLGLAELMGGRSNMKSALDRYFQGGHNDQTNEPSHHAPYLYTAIGYPSSMQQIIRDIAWSNYNATSAGLSGNEDLGQMSAWYLFSAMGFYPVNPASDEYVIGSPFFEKMTIRLPAGASTGGVGGKESTLVIGAPNAPTHPYVKSLKVDGKPIETPVLTHSQILKASKIDFEMSQTPSTWGSYKPT